MVDPETFHDLTSLGGGDGTSASEIQEVQGGYAGSEGMLHLNELMSCGLHSKEVACQCVLSYNDAGLQSALPLHDAVLVRSQPCNAVVLGCRGKWAARQTLNCGISSATFLLCSYARKRGSEGLVVSNGNGGLSIAGI